MEILGGAQGHVPPGEYFAASRETVPPFPRRKPRCIAAPTKSTRRIMASYA